MSPQVRTRGITLAAVAILLLPAFGQTTTTPPATTAGPTTSAPGTTKTNIPTIPSTDNSNTTNNNNTQPPVQRPILISGRVMVDDGTPPPNSAIIERVCNGGPHAEGYTDSQGYFSISLGQPTEVIGDASESGVGVFNRTFPQGGTTGGTGMSGNRPLSYENRYANCDIRARLGGYRSQSITLANHSALDNPDIGTILLHRLGGSDEATTVTATTLRASKPARKALQKGLDLVKKNKTDEAIASFQEAVKVDPEFAFAWCALGRLQVDKEQIADARQSFEAAAKAEPRWPEPLLELSLLAARTHEWKTLNDLSDRVLRMDSFSYPQAFFFSAVANYNLRHFEIAEKSARSAEKLDTQHQYPQIEHLLGTILADHHQYEAAADELRNYLVLAPKATDAPAVRKQLAEVERLAMQSSDAAHKDPR